MILDVEKALEFRRFWCFGSPSLIKKKDKGKIKKNRGGQLGAPKRNHIESFISENLSDMNAKETVKKNKNLKRVLQFF